MGRQNKDQAIVGSSIVLLQERFKELQRLKEMRQESQMLKLMPHEETDRHDHSDPLSLGLTSTSHHHQHHHQTQYFRATNPQHFPAVRGPHNFFEIPDVDTSLRL